MADALLEKRKRRPYAAIIARRGSWGFEWLLTLEQLYLVCY